MHMYVLRNLRKHINGIESRFRHHNKDEALVLECNNVGQLKYFRTSPMFTPSTDAKTGTEENSI